MCFSVKTSFFRYLQTRKFVVCDIGIIILHMSTLHASIINNTWHRNHPYQREQEIFHQ